MAMVGRAMLGSMVIGLISNDVFLILLISALSLYKLYIVDSRFLGLDLKGGFRVRRGFFCLRVFVLPLYGHT